MSDNIKLLLAGAGYMGKEYSKVLSAQGIDFDVVCRSQSTAEKFLEETGIRPFTGGTEAALSEMGYVPERAIVAVSVNQLKQTVIVMIEKGVREILVEKPGGMNRNDIREICEAAEKHDAKVYVAYNRRFYASTEKAKEIIKADGGVSSFNFEFTEWGFKIEKTSHPKEVKEEWLLANSTHVIDLAFYLGGFPEEISTYCEGSLPWHSRASKYAGAGRSAGDVLFSYQANWDAPGRWAVEMLTESHRLYLKPMEKLFIQNRGSVAVEEVEIDDEFDTKFKPGLYRQVEAFMSDVQDDRLVKIEDQLLHMDVYEKIECLD